MKKATHRLKVGDKYRKGKYVITISEVTETHVKWKYEYNSETFFHQTEYEEFSRLAAISMLNGAIFYPAKNNEHKK